MGIEERAKVFREAVRRLPGANDERRPTRPRCGRRQLRLCARARGASRDRRASWVSAWTADEGDTRQHDAHELGHGNADEKRLRDCINQ